MNRPKPASLEQIREHLRAGRLKQARELCRKFLAAEPRNPDALHLKGIVAFRSGRNEDAAGLFRLAIDVSGTVAEFHAALGRVLGRMKKPLQAVDAYAQAVALEAENAARHNDLGLALVAADRPEDAIDAYRKGLKIRPDYVQAYNNLGVALAADHRHAEAVPAYRRAMRIKPEAIEPHANLGRTLLTLGDYEDGWREYEWRWQNPVPAYPGAKQKFLPWDGSDLAGRSILLHAEQGLGDTLQFIRYAPLVKGGPVSVVCPPILHRVLKGVKGVESWHAQPLTGGPLPPADVHASLLSLPRILGTTVHTVPASLPYLEAEAALVDQWAARLAPGDGAKVELRVGLCWAGNPDNPRDRHRSAGLAAFRPLFGLAGIRLFGLQVDDAGRQEISALGAPVTDLAGELTDFAHTAAALKNLDLLISVDTAILHLAGGLGLKAWAMVFFGHDFRWILDREDSPWYPSLRLFRQQTRGDWSAVMGQIHDALKRRAATGSKTA